MLLSMPEDLINSLITMPHDPVLHLLWLGGRVDACDSLEVSYPMLRNPVFIRGLTNPRTHSKLLYTTKAIDVTNTMLIYPK